MGEAPFEKHIENCASPNMSKNSKWKKRKTHIRLNI